MQHPAVIRDKRISEDQYTGSVVKNTNFYNCDFSRADLTDAEFVGCSFYDAEAQVGCRFDRAILKNASFKNSNLTMCSFVYAQALGLELSECRAQGADFSNASFMNQITARTWFCSAFIKQTDLSYADFSRVTLEKCELWGNRWVGANVSGASFSGSDMSGGDFSSLNWASADFTHCNLTDSVLGDVDVRVVDLDGAFIDADQAAQLLGRLGITVL